MTEATPELLAWLEELVDRALGEDLSGDPGRDVTTQAIIPREARHDARLVAREDGVVAGLIAVPIVVEQVARRFGLAVPDVEFHVADGASVVTGDVLVTLSGATQVLLTAERTMLNIASRASGVATHTRRWADALSGTGAKVLDTRKTTPGLRALEKYAVRCGGGTNKRMGLYDVAMIKDNHVAAAGSITAAIDAVRAAFPEVEIQVEADLPEQAVEAVSAGATFLLLDNMRGQLLADTVAAVRAREAELGLAPGTVELEATGNLTLANAREVASSGVDFLSVGGLTHSSPILDLALDLDALEFTGLGATR